ncbi:MAG: ATP-binding protein, partial [Candidatus Omnitrophica bacterium]|nr:ATP-binding protein [Candidatus Omnitrophota bacterium]
MENSLKLLMIDDNPDDALLIRRTLFSYPGQSAPGDPIELVHAESIALGIEHCQRDNIDLVLLDLSLSESRGIETLREFLRYAGAVPVIVLTGLADEQTGLEALNQGAQDYLVKGSIDRSILLRSIRHSIERNRLRRDLEKSLLNRAERLQSEVQSCKALDTMKDEFVHTVSHELRTPLSIIKEGMSLIADQIPGAINDKQRELLQGVQENIDRLGRIINDLLDISKIEAGKVKIEKQPLDICRLIREVIVPFDRRAHKRGLAVTCKLPVESLTLYADSDRLVQAFTNLINNALKFTREGGVVVSLRNEADRVTCVVEDTGIGIAEKDLPKVFGKFQQFGRVPGSGEKGTGLGLSIVKGIIELHGGSIKVASEMG